MSTQTQRRIAVPLSELHGASGRIDAAKLARFLGIPLAQLADGLQAKYPSVHKTPDASSLQDALGPIKRTLELITAATLDKKEALAWLNNPHPDLEGQTPISVILRGQADAVVTLLENAIDGIPS